MHNSFRNKYGGSKLSIEFCAITKARGAPVELFGNLTPDCRPIATKPRFFNLVDREFIQNEAAALLKDDIIEVSNSGERKLLLPRMKIGNDAWLLISHEL